MSFLRKQNKENAAISRISAYREIEGWLTDREALGLYSVASSLGKKASIVEIGSWKGKSTYCLGMGLVNGRIYAIDPFNAEGEPGSREIYEQTKGETPLIDQFRSTMQKHNLSEKIEVLQGYSNQFADRFTDIDFLFIDGDHSIEGCRYDFLTFSPFVRRGGFIAFHDYDPDRAELGPTWVINNLIPGSDFSLYNRYDSLWVAKRIK